jgi:Protochlamydia outer membrane protein
MGGKGRRVAGAIAWLTVATFAGGAHAAPWDPYGDYVQPIVIPPPPGMEPAFELGARMWVSEGKTSFNINSHKADPMLGNPTSTLTYDGMDGVSGEFTFRGKNESNTFTKGFVGAGGLSGGSLDDEDFYAGQIKFSDTFSRIEGSNLAYGTIDLGQSFTLNPRLTVGPFIGFNFWQETIEAFGARCNKDEVGGDFCGPPGFIEVPFSTKVIVDQANWAALRLGTEINLKMSDRLTLIGDLAILPAAYLWNDDSHRLRNNLGPVPNIEDRGTGWGYQLEAEARYDFTPCWSAGAGVRYWFASTGGVADFVPFGAKTKLDDFESQRFGVLGDVSYKF